MGKKLYLKGFFTSHTCPRALFYRKKVGKNVGKKVGKKSGKRSRSGVKGTLRAVVSPGRKIRVRNHCEQPFDFPSTMRVHVTPTSNVKWRHFLLILRENYDLCAPARVRVPLKHHTHFGRSCNPKASSPFPFEYSGLVLRTAIISVSKCARA